MKYYLQGELKVWKALKIKWQKTFFCLRCDKSFEELLELFSYFFKIIKAFDILIESFYSKTFETSFSTTPSATMFSFNSACLSNVSQLLQRQQQFAEFSMCFDEKKVCKMWKLCPEALRLLSVCITHDVDNESQCSWVDTKTFESEWFCESVLSVQRVKLLKCKSSKGWKKKMIFISFSDILDQNFDWTV